MSAKIYLEKSVLAESLLKEPVAIATLFIFTTSNSTKKKLKSVVACTRYHHTAQICFWKITAFFHHQLLPLQVERMFS
jgi:hypothetical protein